MDMMHIGENLLVSSQIGNDARVIGNTNRYREIPDDIGTVGTSAMCIFNYSFIVPAGRNDKIILTVTSK